MAVVDEIGGDFVVSVDAEIEVGAVLGRAGLLQPKRNILVDAGVEIMDRSGSTGSVPVPVGCSLVPVNSPILAGAASTRTGGVK